MATPTLTRAKRDTTTQALDPADTFATKYGPVLTVPEVAGALKLKTATVWGMLDKGILPKFRFPGVRAVRVPLSAVDDYLTRAYRPAVAA